MDIHPSAAIGFARVADRYERGRPDYPPEAIAWLAAVIDLKRTHPPRTVVDLAAGTGKLTRPLAALGCEVIAVEPVTEMRAAIGPGVRALEGTAEAIPLPDECADAVTVGQAFHWFDGRRALREIDRVLRPGGALALVWNRRPLEAPIHAAIEKIVAPHRRTAPAHRSNAWRAAFAGVELLEREFRFSQRLDADGLVDRVGSTSFVAALDARARDDVLARTRALAAEGAVDVPYVCEVHVCRRE